jgi:CBS domain-containing protein
MVERTCDSAVAVDQERVVGILTSTDALVALADAYEGKNSRRAHEAAAVSPPRGGATRPSDREPQRENVAELSENGANCGSESGRR